MNKYLLAGFLLLLAVLTGCARNREAGKRVLPPVPAGPAATLKVELPEGLSSLDPALAGSWSERQVAGLLNRGLVNLNGQSLEPEPALASRWEVSADGLNYAFYLRPEARFAGGRQVTARDVLLSWERLFGPGLPPAASSFLEPVAGYRDRLGGKSRALAGLQVLAPDRLAIRLAGPGPQEDFLASLAHPAAAVVDTSGTPDSPLAGAGPFRLAENLPGEGILTLTANPYYYGGKPATRRLEFYQEPDRGSSLLDFRAGDLDILPDLSPSLRQEAMADRKISRGVTDRYLPGAWLLVLPVEGPLSQPWVKEALRLALDRESLPGGSEYPLLDLLPAGELNSLVAPVGSSYYRQLAVEMLAEGLAGGKGLPALALNPGPGEEAGNLAREVARQWTLLGLKVSLPGKNVPRGNPGEVRLVRWLAPYRGREVLRHDFPAGNVIALTRVGFSLLAKPAIKGLEVGALGFLSLGKAWQPADV